MMIKLENGVRVMCLPLMGLKTVTVRVFVKMGSKYEKKGEFGMSHFLEHMAFKGTKRRLRPDDISREVDLRGAECNAATDQEATCYYVTTIREHLGWAIEILADVLLNSVYKAKEVDKEKGVVMEEIKMYEDNPMMGLADEYAQFLYGGHGVGCFDISGEVGDIVPIKRADVVKYKKRYFDPEKMVIMVVGDVDKKVINRVRDCFGSFKRETRGELSEVKMILNGKKLKVKDKRTEQSHFCIGVPGLPWTDERRYSLRLLEIVLAGNSSSRLFRKIRGERGWAYYVASGGQMYREAGFLAVQAGVRLDKLDEAIDLCKKEMFSIGKNLKLAELEAAKEYLWGRTKLAMDRTSFWANFLGRKLLLDGKMANVDEERGKYMKVSLEETKKLAKELLTAERVRMLVVRNKKI